MQSAVFAAAVLALAAPSLAAAQTAAPFTLTSPDFKDGEMVGKPWAGNNPANRNCVGENWAPALSWSNLPAGTKSLVVYMHDQAGRNGLGVTHWVSYGIPATKTGFAHGEIAKAPAGYVGGKSTQGFDYYMGPCAPPDHGDHHYLFVAIPTDLEPNALPAGLTLPEVLEKLAGGHAKSSAAMVMKYRYAR